MTHVGGPVQKDLDYDRTGATPGLPGELFSRLTPTELGVTDRELWSTYPESWHGSGSILLRPVRDDAGNWYHAAGRIAPRIEDRTSVDRRYYAETRHALARVDQVDFADLLALPAVLVAEPLTAVDWSMPPLAVSGAAPALELARGWVDSVRPLLEAVASGQRWGSVDRESSPTDIFLRSLLCLACLPGALRWRVPIGGGLFQVPSEETDPLHLGLVHGSQSRVGLSPSRPTSAGRAYADWVAEMAGEISTIEQLIGEVDRRLANLRDFAAIGADLPWREAVRALDEVRAIRQVSVYLRGGGHDPEPEIGAIQYFRSAVAREILTESLGPQPGGGRSAAAWLLSQIAVPEWAGPWGEVAEGVDEPLKSAIGAAAGLLGVWGEPDPEQLAIAAPFALDASTGDRAPGARSDLLACASRRLSAALRSCPDSDLPRWANLLAHAGAKARPDWLSRWWDDAQPLVLGRVLHLHFACGVRTRVELWSTEAGGAGATCRLIGGEMLVRDELDGLCHVLRGDASFPTSVLNLSLALMESGRVTEALFLAGWLEEDTGTANWLAEALAGHRLQAMSHEKRCDHAVELSRTMALYGASASILRGLVTLWDALPEVRRPPDTSALRAFLGQPLARLLIDDRQATRAVPDSRAREAARDALLLSPARAVSFLRAVRDEPDAWRNELISQLVGPALQSADVSDLEDVGGAFRFVARIHNGQPMEYPTLVDSSERRFIESLIPYLPPPSVAAAIVTSVDELPAVFAFARWFPEPPSVTSRFLAAHVVTAALDGHSRRYWKEELKAAGWSNLPTWRLLCGFRGVDPLTDDEEGHLSAAPAEDLVRLAIWGLPVSSRLAARLSRTAMELAQLRPDEATRLVELERVEVTYEVFALAWRLLSRDPVAGEWLRVRLGESTLGRLLKHPPQPRPNPWIDVAQQAFKALGRNTSPLVRWLRDGRGDPPAAPQSKPVRRARGSDRDERD